MWSAMFKHINVKVISKDIVNDSIEEFINDTEVCLMINDCVEIIFVCLPNDLNCLVYGYLNDFDRSDIEIVSIKGSNIFVNIKLPRDEIINILNQKDLVGTCESIEITNTKIESNKISIPFNDTRYKIKSEVLFGICNDFYANFDKKLYRSRIISLESLQYVDCKDTNKKTNIYKILGMHDNDSLLECVILLDFKLTLEILQKLIKARITFIISRQIYHFSVLRMAQKFGLTIGYFIDGRVKILSHSSRII